MQKVLVSWSSGKDSAWTLHTLLKRSDIEVVGLLTTINEANNRVSMHGTRKTLLDCQAASCGLPLWPVMLPNPCNNQKYEKAMGAMMSRIKCEGITTVAFGDLFLENVRDYRIAQLKGTGIEPIFPLWQLPTKELSEQMIESGLKAVVVSIDPNKLDPSFIGREYDTSFIRDLPKTVDPCGENGEFHTCVYDGPMFTHPIPVRIEKTVVRSGFFYTDLLPLSAERV